MKRASLLLVFSASLPAVAWWAIDKTFGSLSLAEAWHTSNGWILAFCGLGLGLAFLLGMAVRTAVQSRQPLATGWLSPGIALLAMMAWSFLPDSPSDDALGIVLPSIPRPAAGMHYEPEVFLCPDISALSKAFDGLRRSLDEDGIVAWTLKDGNGSFIVTLRRKTSWSRIVVYQRQEENVQCQPKFQIQGNLPMSELEPILRKLSDLSLENSPTSTKRE